MRRITYKNTITTIPNWINNLHINQPRGYAYETESHFVHFYGSGKGFYGISTGLTAIEKKDGTLLDWVQKVFGAEEIEDLSLDIGHSIKSVWRPSFILGRLL